MKAPGVFKKRYTEKKFDSKIRKKLHIAADRQFVEDLFGETTDPKSGKKFRTFDGSKVTDKKAVKRVKSLAKQIKKQKGRLNLATLGAAAVFFVAVVLAFGVFRNAIARVAIVGAAESAFGAKCDLDSVDFDLFHTRFALTGLAVANRDAPMTNLFEIGEAELNLDLLWLTRGKLRVEQGSITHIAWGTERKTSGALPPKKDKAWLKAHEEADKKESSAKAAAASPVNISAGIGAVTDMLDPQKILDAEIANLSLPGVSSKISSDVPALSDKWASENAALKEKTDATVRAGKAIEAIKPSSLKTVADVQAAIKKVQESSAIIATGVDAAKKTASELKTDLATVASLKKEAEATYKNDSARLANLAGSIKSANLQEGTKVLSSVFETFAGATLGEWYPKAEKAFTMVAGLQKNSAASKKTSLKKKSGALSRLPGRTLAFGVKDAPTVLFRNLALGIDSPGVSGEGTLTEITDNQTLNGKPSGFAVKLSHGAMGETVEGTFDLRDGAEKALDATFTGSGYALSIPAPATPGVPSVKGTLAAKGTLAVLPSGDAAIDAKLLLDPAAVSTARFDPSWAFEAYRDVLSGLKKIDATLGIKIPRNGDPSIGFDTDADKALGAAIASSVAGKIAGVKKDVNAKAQAWLKEQQAAYAPQLSKFDSITGGTTSLTNGALAYEKTADAKKAELEKRASDLAKNAAGDATKNAADAVKKLF